LMAPVWNCQVSQAQSRDAHIRRPKGEPTMGKACNRET